MLRSYFQRVRTLLNRSPADVYRTANEEVYWDHYVKRWQNSKDLRSGAYIGSDWQYADEFVARLQDRASPEKVVLDVGCGGGRIAAVSLKLFKHVHAADLSSEMLRQCQASLEGPRISFHKLDGFTLGGFADESIDLVYAHDVFVQLSSVQIYPYLAEFRRVLRRGGEGLFSCYDFNTQFEVFKKISLKFWNLRTPPYRRLHFVTEEMIRAMLADLALEIVEVHRGHFLTIAFRK
jgi:ubiquinone/menaquinone biosynthesis C-methylase UbiE